jgi:hypothetical protein
MYYIIEKINVNKVPSEYTKNNWIRINGNHHYTRQSDRTELINRFTFTLNSLDKYLIV